MIIGQPRNALDVLPRSSGALPRRIKPDDRVNLAASIDHLAYPSRISQSKRQRKLTKNRIADTLASDGWNYGPMLSVHIQERLYMRKPNRVEGEWLSMLSVTRILGCSTPRRERPSKALAFVANVSAGCRNATVARMLRNWPDRPSSSRARYEKRIGGNTPPRMVPPDATASTFFHASARYSPKGGYLSRNVRKCGLTNNAVDARFVNCLLLHFFALPLERQHTLFRVFDLSIGRNLMSRHSRRTSRLSHRRSPTSLERVS